VVIFRKRAYSAEWYDWYPMTAAGAFFPPSSLKMAWLTVRNVVLSLPASNGTE
jgi:hypothetical protein